MNVVLFFSLVAALVQPPKNIVMVDDEVHPVTAGRWTKEVTSHDVRSVTYVKKLGIVDSKHENGSRDYVIWVPDSAADGAVGIVWFHGHHGFSPRTFKKRILNQFVPHVGKNFFVVIPEMPWSYNTSTRTKRNGRIWQKPGEFVSFIKQVEAHMGYAAGIEVVDWRVVGHSAGGSTIATLGKTGDLCKIGASRVVWSDSSYGTWLDTAYGGCMREYAHRSDVFVTTWGPPQRRAKNFVKRYKGANVKMHIRKGGHTFIGDNIVNLSGLLED